MKKLILLASLVLVLTSCGRRVVILSDNTFPDDKFYLENEIRPYSGDAVIYYKNSLVVKESMHFERGILNGEYISYYKNGQIKCKGNYLQGKLSGTWERWTEKGDRLYHVKYQNDTLQGNAISWHAGGVVEEKGDYNGNKRTGTWVKYDEAGMILLKKNYN